MKPFDDQFAGKVREVFDHHEEPYDPEAWRAMDAMLRKRRRALVIPVYRIVAGVAASLLVIASLTLLLRHDFFTAPAEVADSRIAAEADRPVPGVVQEPAVALAGGTGLPETPVAGGEAVHAEGRAHAAPGVRLPLPDDAGPHGDRLHQEVVAGGDRQGVDAAVAGAQPAVADAAAGKEPEKAVAVVDAAGKPSSRQQEPAVPVPAQGPDPLPLAGGAEGMLRWGVSAGSMLTYHRQQPANGIGFTGGVTTEYRISARFGVNTGLLLAYQQFEIDDLPVSYHEVASGKVESANELASVSTFADQEHEIIAIEIPLNVQFHPGRLGKNRWYLSTGLSSLLYLRQEMSAVETSYIETSYLDAESNSVRASSYASEAIIASSAPPLSRFDFARLLNISAGYAIGHGSVTAVVEPFVKVSLGAVGSHKVSMGMGGVSLRLTFGR